MWWISRPFRSKKICWLVTFFCLNLALYDCSQRQIKSAAGVKLHAVSLQQILKAKCGSPADERGGCWVSLIVLHVLRIAEEDGKNVAPMYIRSKSWTCRKRWQSKISLARGKTWPFNIQCNIPIINLFYWDEQHPEHMHHFHMLESKFSYFLLLGNAFRLVLCLKNNTWKNKINPVDFAQQTIAWKKNNYVQITW